MRFRGGFVVNVFSRSMEWFFAGIFTIGFIDGDRILKQMKCGSLVCIWSFLFNVNNNRVCLLDFVKRFDCISIVRSYFRIWDYILVSRVKFKHRVQSWELICSQVFCLGPSFYETQGFCFLSCLSIPSDITAFRFERSRFYLVRLIWYIIAGVFYVNDKELVDTDRKKGIAKWNYLYSNNWTTKEAGYDFYD